MKSSAATRMPAKDILRTAGIGRQKSLPPCRQRRAGHSRISAVALSQASTIWLLDDPTGCLEAGALNRSGMHRCRHRPSMGMMAGAPGFADHFCGEDVTLPAPL